MNCRVEYQHTHSDRASSFLYLCTMAGASSVGFIKLLESPVDYTVTKTPGKQACIQLFDSEEPWHDLDKMYPVDDNFYYFGYRQASVIYLLLMNMTDISHDIATLIQPHLRRQLALRYPSLKPLYTPVQMYRAMDSFAEECGLDYFDPESWGPSMFEYFGIEGDEGCMVNRRLGHPKLVVWLDWHGRQLNYEDCKNYKKDPETWHIKRREADREYENVGDNNQIEVVNGSGEFANFICGEISSQLERAYEYEAEKREFPDSDSESDSDTEDLDEPPMSQDLVLSSDDESEDESGPEPPAKRRCVIDLTCQ